MIANKLFTLVGALILLSSVLLAGPAKSWSLDKAHSSVTFSVKHFFTPTPGKFDDFDIKINFDPNDLENSSIDVVIQVASINTGNDKRDGHLKTADFFDAEKYPTIIFKSNKIMAKGDNKFVAQGKLKIKETEKDIELPFTLLGVKELPEEMSKAMGGIKEVASFNATYTLDRNDYDVGTGSWAATVVIGDEVTIDISVEVNRK